MGLEWVLVTLAAVIAAGLALTSTRAFVYFFWLLSLVTGAIAAIVIAISLLRLAGIIDVGASGQKLDGASVTGMFYRLSDHPLFVMVGCIMFEAGLLFLYYHAIRGKNRKAR